MSRLDARPSYIFLQPKSPYYYFRWRLPEPLRCTLRIRELRYSLRTTDEADGRYLALRLMRRMNKLTRGRDELMTLTKEEIDRLMKRELQKALDEGEDERLTRDNPWDRETFQTNSIDLGYTKEKLQEQLACGDYGLISGHVESLLEENGLTDIARDGDTYRTLCRELLKTYIRIIEIEGKRDTGDYSDPVDGLSHKTQLAPEPPKDEPKENSKALSVLIEIYCQEHHSLGTWSPKTEHEVRSSFDLLLRILNDIPVATIDVEMFRQFKDTLMKLPPNLRKNPLYRDKSIFEILSMNPKVCINPRTMKKHIERASALFEWAKENGYMPLNPSIKLRIRSNRKASEDRAVFTVDDLTKLFHGDAYLKDSHKQSWQFWIPILGLFTGMRLNEIAQLHLEDIREEGGVHVIDVNDEGVKRLKNVASRRLVPIHDFLTNDLQFLEYVQGLKSRGCTRLFEELKEGRDGYSHEVSKWFARYRRQCGIPDGEKKTFHSFRHTFINTLKQVGIDKSIVGGIVGHADSSITYDRYGKTYNPALLKREAIDKLAYTVDLSHLTCSRFIGK
jgi:integrase